MPVEDSDDNLSQNRLSAIAPVEDSPVLSVLTGALLIVAHRVKAYLHVETTV